MEKAKQGDETSCPAPRRLRKQFRGLDSGELNGERSSNADGYPSKCLEVLSGCSFERKHSPARGAETILHSEQQFFRARLA